MPTTLEGQLRDFYGRVAYTHKTHEKMADGYEKLYRNLKKLEIALSALTTGSLLIAVFGDSKEGAILAAVLSTIMLGITLYFKEASLGEQAQKHTVVASTLWACRERVLSLLIDMRDGLDIQLVRAERDRLTEALEEIYKRAPRTNAKAYRAAQEALKNSEELYFSEAELDKILPQQLRRGN